jgi:hypothetical protein
MRWQTKEISLVLLLIVTVFGGIFLMPGIAADQGPLQAATYFPNSITQMQSAEYEYRQTMDHWKDGQFQSSGTIKINYTEPVYELLRLSLYYDLNVWQKSCTSPNTLRGTMIMSVNRTSRVISNTGPTIGNLNKNGLYSQWIMGQSVGRDLPMEFFLEELMYLHGFDSFLNKTFTVVETAYVQIHGRSIEALRLNYQGQASYYGLICGLGYLPTLNMSYDYYYEVNSGLLLYARAVISEYLEFDPTVYQTHTFTRILHDLRFEGQSDLINPTTPPAPTVTYPWDNPEERDRFFAFLTLGGILVGGILAFILIHYQGKRWRVKAFLELEARMKAEEANSAGNEVSSENPDTKE